MRHDDEQRDPDDFPKPIKLGPSVTAWALSDLERFEHARRGSTDTAERAPVDERYLRPREVAERYGITLATLWRWSAHGFAGRAPRRGVSAAA